jgi:hypothetical protein
VIVARKRYKRSGEMKMRMAVENYHSLYWSFHWAFHPSGTLGGGGPGGGVAPKSFIVIARK